MSSAVIRAFEPRLHGLQPVFRTSCSSLAPGAVEYSEPLQSSLLPEHGELGRNDEARRFKNLKRSIDEWTNEVIQSGFDDTVLGRVLDECIDTTESLETAVAVAAIVAKAKVARRRRR